MNACFADTSFFKGYADEKDDFHMQSLAIFGRLRDTKTTLVTSNYVLDETFTLLRVRCDLATAVNFKAILEEFETGLKIVRVLAADDAHAWEWFINDWSKLSFTDCVSFAMMKRLEITHVAAFDEHFKRAGFTPLT